MLMNVNRRAPRRWDERTWVRHHHNTYYYYTYQYCSAETDDLTSFPSPKKGKQWQHFLSTGVGNAHTHSPHHWTCVTVSPWEQWVAEKIVPKQTPGWSSGSHLQSRNATALYLKIKQHTTCKQITARVQTVMITITIHHNCIFKTSYM